jgi:CheY-like chemotaxis protein
MVHGLAEQCGGRFTLQSQKGEGTTAELWLPVAKAQTHAIDNIQLLAGDAVADRGAFVVIAVDDDRLVLTNTTAMLEDLGHTVFPASSGKEAIDILRREDSVDLVITDQVMPHMTGLQLAEAIQKEWPGLSVIVATGYAEIEAGAGMGLPKLSKPFTEDELAEKLKLILPRIRKSGRVLKFRAGANSTV